MAQHGLYTPNLLPTPMCFSVSLDIVLHIHSMLHVCSHMHVVGTGICNTVPQVKRLLTTVLGIVAVCRDTHLVLGINQSSLFTQLHNNTVVASLGVNNQRCAAILPECSKISINSDIGNHDQKSLTVKFGARKKSHHCLVPLFPFRPSTSLPFPPQLSSSLFSSSLFPPSS